MIVIGKASELAAVLVIAWWVARARLTAHLILHGIRRAGERPRAVRIVAACLLAWPRFYYDAAAIPTDRWRRP